LASRTFLGSGKGKRAAGQVEMEPVAYKPEEAAAQLNRSSPLVPRDVRGFARCAVEVTDTHKLALEQGHQHLALGFSDLLIPRRVAAWAHTGSDLVWANTGLALRVCKDKDFAVRSYPGEQSMSDKAERSADPILDILREQERAARERSERHEAVRASAPYQKQLERLGNVTHAFLGTLRVCAFAATRDPSLPEVSFFLRNLDDLSQSAVMAAFAFREGGLNSGRRELRFMLELSVQSLFVDKNMGQAPFEQRLVFFERKTKNTSVDHVKDLPLEMLGGSRENFVVDTVRAWSKASQYVHPTPQQLREKLDLRERGITPGCETRSSYKLASMNCSTQSRSSSYSPSTPSVRLSQGISWCRASTGLTGGRSIRAGM
jgi:hypothetical protein